MAATRTLGAENAFRAPSSDGVDFCGNDVNILGVQVRDELVARHEYAEMSPRVEYQLTELGAPCTCRCSAGQLDGGGHGRGARGPHVAGGQPGASGVWAGEQQPAVAGEAADGLTAGCACPAVSGFGFGFG